MPKHEKPCRLRRISLVSRHLSSTKSICFPHRPTADRSLSLAVRSTDIPLQPRFRESCCTRWSCNSNCWCTRGTCRSLCKSLRQLLEYLFDLWFPNIELREEPFLTGRREKEQRCKSIVHCVTMPSNLRMKVQLNERILRISCDQMLVQIEFRRFAHIHRPFFVQIFDELLD